MQSPHLSWTTVAVGLVVLLAAAWVVRGTLSGPGSATRSQTAVKQGETTAVVRSHKAPVKPVTLNGNAIQAAGAVLTLNPALAQPGGTLTLGASGFDARSPVDVTLSAKGAKTGTSLGTFKTDKDGGFSAEAQVPETLRATSVLVTAHQRNSDNVATAEAVTASGLATASLSKTTGQPGKTVSVTARGFTPGEGVKVYWGRASGPSSATLQADQGGGISQAPVRVGVGGVGATTLVLVGVKSGTTATVPFYRLGLYPVAGARPYALKAGQDLGVTGSGFAPDEPVLVYVNTSSGPPAMTAHADSQGNLGGIGFTVPFGLRGAQSLVLVGAKSRASVTSGFDVLPYSPTVQPSTYGGSPGTTFSFFTKGFAANEVVLVYLGRSKDSAGQLVSAFRVDDQGSAGAAGSYQITAADQGTLTFTLVGRKSDGRATTSIKVSPAAGPVDVPTRKPFTLPPDLRN